MAIITRTHKSATDPPSSRSRNPAFDVAIHAPYAAPLYMGSPQPVGGAEIQTRRLAAALTAAGLRVCHIVFDTPGLPSEVDGIHLFGQRRPGTTRVHTAAYCLRDMLEVDSHVYIQRGAGWETGIVGLTSRLRGRAFIFSSACDIDFSGNYLLGGQERALFALGTRLATVAVVQTSDQLRLAREQRSSLRRTELIRSFGPEPDDNQEAHRCAFLWIGRLDPVKEPLRYLELAARLPEATFWMLVTQRERGPRGLDNAILEQIARLPNVTLLEPRPRRELLPLYRQAVALVNTSQDDGEGFPNLFMEAWAAGTPVLTLNFDPDAVVSTYGLGEAADGSMERLAEAAQALWSDRGGSKYSRSTREYLRQFHSSTAVGSQWVALVRSLIRDRPGRRRTIAPRSR